jgi:hypothetical protein
MINMNFGMTVEEIRERANRLGDSLEDLMCRGEVGSKEWKDTYEEYGILNGILDEIYREENQESFDKFVDEHIRGKSREEIDPDDWSFYSDWHKDMYGFRPRRIPM